MFVRVLLALCALAIVVPLLAWSLTRERRYLRWSGFMLQLTLAGALAFGLLYLLERLLLRF